MIRLARHTPTLLPGFGARLFHAATLLGLLQCIAAVPGGTLNSGDSWAIRNSNAEIAPIHGILTRVRTMTCS
ncbi:hypothetical protein WJX81_006242 [Elliptochloris bilobata]|uniref:Secreted protein n=1 Tax=Elliptochloris bilobata TaxID=381761 RepID=A0AAW1RMD4_9CHLO